jgi:hypothetical protein
MDTARNSTALDLSAAQAPRPDVIALVTVDGRPEPATRANRQALLLRHFGRISALLSTCAAALPPECPAGEPDVRASLDVAARMLHDAIANLESLNA